MATQLLKCNASSPFFATPKHAPPRLSRHQCRATLNDDKVLGIGLLDKAYVGRRTLLLSGSATVAGLTVAPRPVTAGANKAKEDSVINDPAALRSQLQAQYAQWAQGQRGFEAWLAGPQVSETVKWSSNYTGAPTKFKGRAGARQYWEQLAADLDIKTYQPLAIFVDNDGDEATVVVEVAGASRRNGQPFKTVFLHSYAVAAQGLVIKFKEQTDTALMADLVPPTEVPAAAAGVEGGVAEGGTVAPGSAALKA